MIGYVVLDAPCLQHAGCRDDDGRIGVVVQALGVLGLRYVGKRVETEWIRIRSEHFLHIFIHLVQVVGEDSRCVNRQWTIHIHVRAAGELVGIVEVIQGEDNLLRASNREGGYNQFSLSFVADTIRSFSLQM